MKTIPIAGVQIEAHFGKTQENLDHAATFVEAAAHQGAQLVLLPELMPSGYVQTRDLWNWAEPEGGRTENWLCQAAERLGIYLGTSYLEADRTDFYDTFALAAPQGRIAGRVRKQFPAFSEPNFFRGASGSHSIDTDLGRIGVGICNDNHMTAFARLLEADPCDLLLMPHAWPLAVKTGKAISQADIDHQRGIALSLAPLYARSFGIPAVMVNHCGPCAPITPPGLIIKLLPSADFYRFPGLSVIADSDGSVRAQAGAEEGFIIARVTLDPARKHLSEIPDYGGHVYPASAGRNLVKIDEMWGRIRYTLSRRRLETAERISDRGPRK